MAKSPTKLPKRIGGVKVPKKVRKQADQAIRFAEQHPILGEAVAGALLAAAAALTSKGKPRADPDAIPADLVNEARRAGEIIKDAALAIGRTLLEEAGKLSDQDGAPNPDAKSPRRPKKPKLKARSKT